MATLRQQIVSFDHCKASLEIAYADLAELTDANAVQIKEEINKLIERCALSASILQDIYDSND